jgi:hypothetical protein
VVIELKMTRERNFMEGPEILSEFGLIFWKRTYWEIEVYLFVI